MVDDVELTVVRWRRFGHDRLYVNRDGEALGHLDLTDLRIHASTALEGIVDRATQVWAAQQDSRT